MKDFLKKGILFLMPIVVIVGIFDLYLRQRPSLYKVKIDGINSEIQQLVMGNSHAHYAVDPKQFSLSTYNLAHQGQSLYFDRRICEKYRNQMPNLKRVLISVDFHSFSFSSQGIANEWSYYAHGIKYKDDSYLLANLSPFFWGYTPVVSISYLKKDLTNWVKYRGQNYIQYDVETGVNLLDSIHNGFLPYTGQDKSLMTEIACKRRAQKFNNRVKNTTEKAEIVEDLKGFIKYLQAENIKIVLFASPTYTVHNKFRNPKYLSENRTVINKLCSDFSIPYWDYSASNEFDLSDFYNNDHLNRKGAEKFSKMLNSRLNELD